MNETLKHPAHIIVAILLELLWLQLSLVVTFILDSGIERIVYVALAYHVF